MLDMDSVTEGVAQYLAEHGYIVTVQPARHAGHIGWGGHRVADGEIPGVRWMILVDQESVAGQVRIETQSHEGFTDLGFGLRHKRVRSMRWRIAEGYVNGYPILDIIWYAITRYRASRHFYRHGTSDR